MPKNRKKSKLKLLAFFAGILVFIFIVLGAWLYNGQLTQAKQSLFKVFPYPLALVNGRPVLMKTYLERLELAKNVAIKNNQTSNLAKNVYNQVLKEASIKEVAAKSGVSVTKKELDEELAAREKTPGFKETLAGYKISEADFETEVLKSELLVRNLQIWFNSQKNLNKEAYALAESLQNRNKNGEDFSMLAQQYSNNTLSQQTKGDMGLVDSADLLSELREQVENLKVGEVKILPSRYGLHLVKKESVNQNRSHLRQIFIKTSDFNTWLDKESKSFKVFEIYKFN